MKTLRKTELVISDHAMLRYIERVIGVDLEPIRQKIVDTVEPAYKAGATRISADGVTYSIRSNFVTSTLPGASPQGSYLGSEKRKGRSVRLREAGKG